MALIVASIVFCLVALLLVSASLRRLRRRKLWGGLASGVAALFLFALAAGAALVAINLRTYQRLTFEQAAGEIELHQTGNQQYTGVLTFPSGERSEFALRGDEWQVDARLLKWRGLANLLGFDTAYRLERISGRYLRVDEERTQPRTVYAVNPPDSADLWALARQYHSWLPWVDACYGGAVFLPMADGALYEIDVAQSGLLGRPLNQAARDAVKNWR